MEGGATSSLTTPLRGLWSFRPKTNRYATSDRSAPQHCAAAPDRSARSLHTSAASYRSARSIVASAMEPWARKSVKGW